MEVQRPTLITQSQKDEHKLVEFSKPQNHIATVNNNDNSKK